MQYITKPSSTSKGNIKKIQITFPDQIQSMTILEGFFAQVQFSDTGGWHDLYFTPGTFSFSASEKVTQAGVRRSYKISFMIPKDRQDLISKLDKISRQGLIFKITDANDLSRIYGTNANPMKASGQQKLPGKVEGFNGYKYTFQGNYPDPAYIESEEASGSTG